VGDGNVLPNWLQNNHIGRTPRGGRAPLLTLESE
jgi:hypothetical protein